MNPVAVRTTTGRPPVLLRLRLRRVGRPRLHDGVQGVGEAFVQVAVLVRVVSAVHGPLPIQRDLGAPGYVPGRIRHGIAPMVEGVEHLVLRGDGAVDADPDNHLVREPLVR